MLKGKKWERTGTMSNFKAKTESFLNTVKCEVKTIQDSDYELELNLNSK